LIDLQEQLREAVGKPKKLGFIEPGTDSVLEFVHAVETGRDLVVVDVETTGIDTGLADLVEVAAVKIRKGKIADRWSTLVKPARPIVGNQMHGITNADVADAPSPKKAAETLFDWAGDATIIGHNVGFDLGFLT